MMLDVANVWMTGSGNQSEISSIRHHQVIADLVSPGWLYGSSRRVYTPHSADCFPAPDKWRSPCWLLTPCHSFLPCGSSGSGPAQAINHGDTSAQGLQCSYFLSWSRSWSTWGPGTGHRIGIGCKKCRFPFVCVPWAKLQFSSSVEIEVIHYLEAIYNWFKWDKKSF